MSITATDIINRALTLIDESVTTFTMAATTEKSMSEIASEILPEVCHNLVKELPYESKRYLSVPSTSLAVDSLINGESQEDYFKQKVAIIPPDDFWELVAVRMTVWARPVTDYIIIDDKLYSKQNNPFTRNGKQNPVVAVSNSKIGGDMRIELFSIESGDVSTIDVFEYVSYDNVPDDDTIEWPDELMDEISKALASQLNLIKGRIQESSIMGEEAANIIATHE